MHHGGGGFLEFYSDTLALLTGSSLPRGNSNGATYHLHSKKIVQSSHAACLPACPLAYSIVLCNMTLDCSGLAVFLSFFLSFFVLGFFLSLSPFVWTLGLRSLSLSRSVLVGRVFGLEGEGREGKRREEKRREESKKGDGRKEGRKGGNE